MTTGRYAHVNGLEMYYEVHGAGRPLVLIHGGGSTIETSFGRILPLLARSHQVIAVEVQAHGHTRDIDRPFTFEQDADDVAALLEQIGAETAAVLGFSNGGTTALQMAIRHPRRVRRIIVASANYSRAGMPPGFWESMDGAEFADMPQIYKDNYLGITQSTDRLMTMFKRSSSRMQRFTDIPSDDIKSITAPVLVMVGDRDVVSPEHAVELFRMLPNGRLCILPGGHGSYFGEIMTPGVPDRVVAAFVSIVEEFLSDG
ncbi:MAG: alpha/beta fold hydrolase [Gemmatimonadaceae bacterium]